VSPMELRLLLARVDESRDEAAAIGNHQLQRRRGGTLIVAGGVVCIPHQHGRDGRVQARGHQEGHAVFDLGVRDGDVGDHRVPDDGWDECE